MSLLALTLPRSDEPFLISTVTETFCAVFDAVFAFNTNSQKAPFGSLSPLYITVPSLVFLSKSAIWVFAVRNFPEISSKLLPAATSIYPEVPLPAPLSDTVKVTVSPALTSFLEGERLTANPAALAGTANETITHNAANNDIIFFIVITPFYFVNGYFSGLKICFNRYTASASVISPSPL